MIERKQGRIVFVSSILGLMSCIGYAQYCPSKYALRGLAESLRNEMVMFNIGVHIFYPSNIDTPGFVVENLTKPPVTVKLEGRIDTVKPEHVSLRVFVVRLLKMFSAPRKCSKVLQRISSKSRLISSLKCAALEPTASLHETTGSQSCSLCRWLF